MSTTIHVIISTYEGDHKVSEVLPYHIHQVHIKPRVKELKLELDDGHQIGYWRDVKSFCMFPTNKEAKDEAAEDADRLELEREERALELQAHTERVHALVREEQALQDQIVALRASVPECVLPDSVLPDSVLPDSLVSESVVPESVVPESVPPDSERLSSWAAWISGCI